MGENVVDRFQPSMFSDEIAAEVDLVSSAFQGLAALLDEALFAGRYKSLALTALEEALVWTYRAMSEDRP
jgi:hypothetical protein